MKRTEAVRALRSGSIGSIVFNEETAYPFKVMVSLRDGTVQSHISYYPEISKVRLSRTQLLSFIRRNFTR